VRRAIEGMTMARSSNTFSLSLSLSLPSPRMHHLSNHLYDVTPTYFVAGPSSRPRLRCCKATTFPPDGVPRGTRCFVIVARVREGTSRPTAPSRNVYIFRIELIRQAKCGNMTRTALPIVESLLNRFARRPLPAFDGNVSPLRDARALLSIDISSQLNFELQSARLSGLIAMERYFNLPGREITIIRGDECFRKARVPSRVASPESDVSTSVLELSERRGRAGGKDRCQLQR